MRAYLNERRRLQSAGGARRDPTSAVMERGRAAAARHQAGEAEAWARRRRLKAV